MISLVHGPGRSVRAPRAADFSFATSYAESLRPISPAGCVPATVLDSVVSRCTSEMSVTDKQLSLTVLTGGAVPYTLAPSAPSVFSVSASGRCTYVSSGSGSVIVRSRYGQISAGATAFSTVGGGQTDTFSSNVAGSLSASLLDAMQAQLSGLTTTAQAAMFAASGLRNPSRWAPSLDLSGVATRQFPVTRISPTGYLCSSHVLPGVGSALRFVNAGNAFEDTTVSATRISLGDDVHLIRSTTTLSSGVRTYPILPAVGTRIVNGRPGLFARLWNSGPRLWASRVPALSTAHWFTDGQPIGNAIIDASPGPFSGDSGSPFFAELPAGPALVSHAVGIGSICYGPKAAAINAALATFGESASYADLSGFPTY